MARDREEGGRLFCVESLFFDDLGHPFCSEVHWDMFPPRVRRRAGFLELLGELGSLVSEDLDVVTCGRVVLGLVIRCLLGELLREDVDGQVDGRVNVQCVAGLFV
jgi:hypothetical protein